MVMSFRQIWSDRSSHNYPPASPPTTAPRTEAETPPHKVPRPTFSVGRVPGEHRSQAEKLTHKCNNSQPTRGGQTVHSALPQNKSAAGPRGDPVVSDPMHPQRPSRGCSPLEGPPNREEGRGTDGLTRTKQPSRTNVDR